MSVATSIPLDRPGGTRVTKHFLGPDGEDSSRAGPLAAEAVRLASALQGWMQGWAEHNVGDTSDGHTCSDCRWCPLCQFVAVVRGERPEVTERVAEVATAVAAALHAVVDAAGAGGQPGRAHPSPTPRVQKINLGDEG